MEGGLKKAHSYVEPLKTISMNRLILTALSVLTLLAAGCSNDIKEEEPPFVICPNPGPSIMPTPEGELTDLTRSSINHINDFGVELLKNTMKVSEGNVCVSPISVSAVLSMLANGDTGDTRDEVLTLLQFDKGQEGLDELNFYNKTILSNLPSVDPATTYIFTNTYWHDPLVFVREDFAERIADTMFASVIDYTPAGQEGMEAINQFVEINTNGLIKNFIEKPIDNITSAFLNTTYFKGEWSDQFMEEATIEDDFLNLDGSISKAQFMRKTWVEYAETADGTKAVRLPYGNGNFHMTVILPTDQINHVPLLECLDHDNLEKINETLKMKHIAVELPKFESESKAELLEVLKGMGLNKACDFKYGFDAITWNGSSVLALFKHAVKLIVNEEGTEGAAASMGGMIDSAGPDPVEIPVVSFDRPFVYLIQENTTGAILFIGVVTNFKNN